MWTVAYIAAIVIVNWAFGYIGVQPIPGTDQVWHPLSLIVGLWFVLRDFAHREIGGGWIYLPILVGMGLSFILAAPQVALASATAFVISEIADTVVFQFTRRPFAQRIVFSSLIGVPLDSVIFLWLAFGATALSPIGVGAMMAAKMLGALVVAYGISKRNLPA